MAIRPYAGGGAQAFQGDNQPLYVQNQNELKKAFNQVQASSISGAAPIGSVIMWAGTSANAPSTYAVCNGASLSTTGTYAALFAVIGYRYGGSGPNFNLPDFHSNVLNPTGSVPVRFPQQRQRVLLPPLMFTHILSIVHLLLLVLQTPLLHLL